MGAVRRVSEHRVRRLVRSHCNAFGEFTSERDMMQIPKDKLLEMLQQQGKGDQVNQARQQLPDKVDTEQHADLLQKLGLNPQELLSKLGGNIPGL